MKTYLLRCIFALSILVFSTYLKAQPGALDSSFGVNGKVSYSFATISSYTPYCEPVALQTDGKIVIASSYHFGVDQSVFIISRFKTNGTLDSSFGVSGYITTTFDSSVSQNSWGGFIATCVLIQPDGKILAGGYGYVPFTGPKYFCLARYQTNGKPDSSFGINGKAMDFIGPFPKENELYSLVLQPDGRIVAGGWSDGYCVVRYKSNGTIDSSFAVNGIMRNQDIQSYGPTHVALQQDGKIVTGAQSDFTFGSDTMFFLIERLTANGRYDSSFGVNGHVFTAFNSSANYLYSAESLKDGKILAVGSSAGNVALSKYKSNGLLDSSFALNGKLVSQFGVGANESRKVLIQYDNKIIVIAQTTNNSIAVIRLFPNGSVDSSFGVNGKCIFNFGAGTYAYSGALQTDGKIIAVGNPNISIARIKGSEPVQISLKKNISVVEGSNGATTPAQFKVILSKQSPTDVFVNYTTHNLTALAGSDYTIALGTLRIKAGKTSGNIIVPVIGDNVREANERFSLVLSNPVNAVFGTVDSAVCVIKNDDLSLLQSSSEQNIISNVAPTVYPNPAKNVITIDGLDATEPSDISIINTSGQTVLKGKSISTTTYSVNIKQFVAGTYLITIQTGKTVRSLKFIKE